jgi:hypothetical protein
LERQAREFDNILEEGKFPSSHSMDGEEYMVEFFDFPIQKPMGKLK